MHIASIGIDLGKTTFHLVALDECGKVVDPQEVLPPSNCWPTRPIYLHSLIGMEACSGAHFLGRRCATRP